MRSLLGVVALVVVAVVAGSGCAGSGESVAANCDLSGASVAPVPTLAVGSAVSEASPVLAEVTSVGTMNESGTITVVTVHFDGSTSALTSGSGPAGSRSGRLAPADLTRLQRCIDESHFLDIEEGYRSGTDGRSGGSFCSISDAPYVTVAARGSSGVTRTATGYALGMGDCIDYPRGLTEVHGALEQVRHRVADGSD